MLESKPSNHETFFFCIGDFLNHETVMNKRVNNLYNAEVVSRIFNIRLTIFETILGESFFE